MAFQGTKDRIEYFVACVTEFADAFGLDYQKSFDYLDRHIPSNLFLKQKGSNFVTRSINYQKSYTQVNGVIALCRNALRP